MKKQDNLLEEGTIRRFMKLAALEPLTESFTDNQLNEEPVDTMYEAEEEEALAPEEDFAAEPAAVETPDTPLDEPTLRTIVQAVVDAVEEASGLPVNGPDETEAEEFEDEDEFEMEVPAEEAPEAEMAPEELEEEVNEITQNEVIEEVARRVAARLLQN